jgi:hypothetical protein
MHDGFVRTLFGVRHVPELKKNLISLGALDSVGWKYVCEGGVLSASLGAQVFLKGQKLGNLYVLDGSTIVGVSSLGSSSVLNSSSTIGSMREGIQGSVVGSWGSAVESVNSVWSLSTSSLASGMDALGRQLVEDGCLLGFLAPRGVRADLHGHSWRDALGEQYPLEDGRLNLVARAVGFLNRVRKVKQWCLSLASWCRW